MVLSYSDANKIAIVDYLAHLGFEPDRIHGTNYWYRSPIPARNENKPSFKVETQLNLWYDHGIGEGGTLLDLGAKLHQCSIQEFIDMLSNVDHSITSIPKQISNKIQDSKIEILSVKGLSSPMLLQYLKNRGINADISKFYCKEIEFSISKKKYEAVGFQNRTGGFELRNTWFKGSSSPKDISLIKNQSEKLCTVEGFVDFLSLFHLRNDSIKSLVNNSDFLILNSLSFIGRSLPILESYRENVLFLDNDTAGNAAKTKLESERIRFNDGSRLFSAYKDVNDYLVQSHQAVKRLSNSKNIRL